MFYGDKEKNEHLAKIVSEARAKLQEAMDFADANGLIFRWDDEYGSRKQTYVGKGALVPARESGWTSSSDGC
jgi:hypothetical protein